MAESRAAANKAYLDRMGLIVWAVNIYPEDKAALQALGKSLGNKPMFFVLRHLLQEVQALRAEVERLEKAHG